MKTEKFDILVAGGGLAGIVTADILADHGLSCVVLDENRLPGGQILRRQKALISQDDLKTKDQVKRIGLSYLKKVENRDIALRSLSQVVGVYDDNKVLIQEGKGKASCLQADMIVLATGARERFLPFRGWTLPGVIATGALQIFIKGSGFLPSRELVIAGAGPLLLAQAYEALNAGAKVLGLLDFSNLAGKIPLPGQLRGQGPKILEGLKCLARIKLTKTPTHFGSVIVEARGKKRLREVIAAKIDSTGNVLPKSEFRIKTECLAVGFGFTANIELAQQAGCEIEFDRLKGGFVVKTNAFLETSLENVFAAGEITAIAGVLKSLLEGKLCAYGILKKLGKLKEEQKQKKLIRLLANRKRHLAFGAYLNSQTRIYDNLLKNIDDKAIICRCEDVTMASIRKALAQGHDSPLALKRALRLGMGKCQGRTCMPLVYDILASLKNGQWDHIDPLSARPPVKPIKLGDLLD